MTSIVVYGLVKALHNLATVLWIGGLIQLSFVVLPAFRKKLRENDDLKPILVDVQRRVSLFVTVSIPVLVITGILESLHSKEFIGFFSFGNTYSTLLSVKHILVIAMICIAISRKSLMRRNAKLKTSGGLTATMILVNALLGVAVVILSGFCSAVGS